MLILYGYWIFWLGVSSQQIDDGDRRCSQFIEEHLVIGFKQFEDIDIRWVVLFQNVIKDFANRGIRIEKLVNVVWIGFCRH